ncbi:MAG: hypothetical protein DCC65_03260 [Planctomycetota bacterium]|nr:MAG: hypothetical protein DCC65_03260 [Planctomycetota bacterium]
MIEKNPKLSAAEQVVEEIREVRRRLWSRAGNDVRRFLEELNRSVPWENVKTRPADAEPIKGTARLKP